MDGPYWCGDDGKWVEVWPSKTPPVAAKFTVFRDGVPHTGIAHYDEFVQTNPAAGCYGVLAFNGYHFDVIRFGRVYSASGVWNDADPLIREHIEQIGKQMQHKV